VGFVSGPKFCIGSYIVYNFHFSISEHYSQRSTHTTNQEMHDLKLPKQVDENCALLGY
jgi:hypothetical protein